MSDIRARLAEALAMPTDTVAQVFDAATALVVFCKQPALARALEDAAGKDARIAELEADRAELLEAARMALADCCDLIETDAGRALQAAIARAAGGGHD